MTDPAMSDPGTGERPVPFGARLQEAVRRHGPMVAGVDPHGPLLAAWGLGDDPAGLRTFALGTLDAVAGEVAAIKPQSAFFERHGSAGIAVLEELLTTARERGVLSILDVKRGDIGSTMSAYAQAYLPVGAPLEADAITVSPYLGVGALTSTVDLAAEHGKGLFVLALTSNPEGAAVQHAGREAGRAVARAVVEEVEADNARLRARGLAAPWGSVGLVVGATTGQAARDLGIDLASGTAPLLAPGFGAQGAGPAELGAVFGAAADRVLVSVSRALLAAGPERTALGDAARVLRTAYARTRT